MSAVIVKVAVGLLNLLCIDGALNDDGQRQGRGPFWFVVNSPLGDKQSCPCGQRLSRAEVACEARMRATGDLQPHPVAAREPVGGRP